MKFIEQVGRGKTLKDINIRQGQASTAVPVASRAASGQILDFVGFVSDGENVAGNSKWFKTKEGNYFWSGNVEVLPDAKTLEEYENVTEAQLCAVVPGIAVSKAAEFTNALNAAMQEFSINTPLRQAAFIAQTAHESMGYSVFVENLNYSAKTLSATWPRRFTTDIAGGYARKPEKIANCAYANRLGNGNETSGDGWRYRGRGVIQVTGRDNYRACGIALGLDLIHSPEVLEQPLTAFRSGAWFWNSRSLNILADKGDFVGITRKINGGTLGLDDRMKYYRKAKATLGIV
jgi:putative chitinase